VSSLPEIEEPDPETVQESAALESEETVSTPSTGRQFRELDLSDPETRLVVFVVAPKGGSLSGAHIQTVVERCGMEFGQMDLFHRFEDNSDHSPIQFTMSDVGEPGSFNIDTLANHETPAVTFFMSMTEPRDPSYAVDCMLATAETLAKALGGEMLDSDRSVMRPQTQEHYRELVKAYKLRSRAKSRRTRKSK
jgi:cell division protein ZipA